MEEGEKQAHSPGLKESRIQHLQGSAWKSPMRILWDKALKGRRSLRKLIDTQETTSLMSRMIYFSKQCVRQNCEEACVDGQSAPGQPHKKKV